MLKKCHLPIWQYLICTALLVTGFATNINAQIDSEAAQVGFFTSSDRLMKAKRDALNKEALEIEKSLAEAELSLLKEKDIENRVFDTQAYLAVSIKNTAPPLKYELKWTKIYIDGRLFAQGGKKNDGLPRSSPGKSELFLKPVPPGCHEMVIKAQFIRLTNEQYNLFDITREVNIERRQAFIAKNGYLVSINIEGLEVPNDFVNFYRTPAFRFNNEARPNFLLGKPLVSFDEIAREGRVVVDYTTGDTSHDQLIKKIFIIDGLNVFVDEQHESIKNRSIVFDRPLTEGRHTIKITLVFGQKTWIGGGPVYNFRQTFDREFYVMAGNTTILNVTGRPKDGVRSTEEDSRYARVTSQIKSVANEDFFPESTCKEIKAQERAEQERLKKQESKKTQSDKSDIEEAKPKIEPTSGIKSNRDSLAPQPLEPKKNDQSPSELGSNRTRR